MLKQKLAEMSIRCFVGDAMVFRALGDVDRALEAIDPTNSTAVLKTIEGFAVECSVNKVYTSEALAYVVDEAVQIFGGNGYSREFPVERAYRDARITRIYEGTNEINRLLIPGMLAKWAVKNELPVIAAAKTLRDELLGPPAPPEVTEGALAAERRAVDAMKKPALMVFGTALQTFGPKLTDEQEVLMHTADIMMDVFAAESAVLRAAGPEA